MRKEVKSCFQLRQVVYVYKLNLVKLWCIIERYYKLSMIGFKVDGDGWVQIFMKNLNFLKLYGRIIKNFSFRYFFFF